MKAPIWWPASNACSRKALRHRPPALRSIWFFLLVLSAFVGVLLLDAPIASVGLQPAFAESMPDEAPAELSRILEDKQFHPRGKEDTTIERLKRQVLNAIQVLLKKIDNMISWPDFEVNRDTPLLNFFRWIGGLFVSILDGLRWLFSSAFYAIPVLLLLYFAYRLVQKYRVHPAAAGEQPPVEEQPKESLDDLLKGRRYDDLLSGIRQALRNRWFDKYALPLSMTDWEVRRVLPANEHNRPLFEEIASVFEQRVFAGRSIEEERIHRLYHAFRESAPESSS